MENGVTQGSQTDTMGATENATRLASLQERKKNIEQALVEKNRELRQLCIKEAELTGVMPLEIPLEPGESSPPAFRRRVGTSYQLSQNLINSLNNKEESIAALELQKQVQANMAEAALGLANEPNSTKSIKRQHKTQYQYHKQQYNLLEEKITALKAQMQAQQEKHKKKPRPSEQEDSTSVSTCGNDSFGKSSLRHSRRSLQASITETERMYPLGLTYLPSDVSLANTSPVYLRSDEALANGLYRLSLSGYKSYMERRESSSSLCSSQSSPQYHPNQTHLSVSRNPSPPYYYQKPTLRTYYTSLPSSYQNKPSKQLSSSPTSSQLYQYPKMEHTVRVQQLQPHQRYDNDMVALGGLGGYWKRTESGEMVWTSAGETSWQRDRRFGSLDRRKNRRVHKRTSPLTECKLMGSPSVCSEQEKLVASKPATVNENVFVDVGRSRADHRQLMRTQSLGSVGVQTVTNLWPSDDNSSCENDTLSINDTASFTTRKQKQKEWYETSLDAPPPPVPRSQSTIPTQDMQMAADQVHKIPLEIPAESNPSPKTETNLEMYKNNIPKNCTVVQEGICKPYYEETKPFEMSDFYKYSTKFKKSPYKVELEVRSEAANSNWRTQRNLVQTFDSNDNAMVKTVYQPLQVLNCQGFNPSNNNNGSNVGFGKSDVNER